MEIVPIAKSAANPVAGFVFDKCKDWVNCVLTYKENVKKVQELRNTLEARQKHLQDLVADCTRKGQQVAREVHLWLEQIRSLLESKNTDDGNGWEDMLKDEMARKEAEQCCLGFCSWNPKYRHHLSRIAAEKIQKIEDILWNSKLCLSSLSVDTAPPSLENLRTHFWEGLKSRVELLNRIMEKLNKNDQEGFTIGIHGMGGADEWTKDLLSLSLLMNFDSEKREVKIHDEIRAALISFATKGKHVFHVGAIPRWLEVESYKKFTAISILADDSFEYLSGQKLLKLQLLSLACTSRSKLHNHYFLGMVNMKVLRLSNCELETLPGSIDCLKNLVTLILELCKLDNILKICSLVKLQVLSFYGSSISRLPKELENLVKLKVLDMTDCDRLSEIPAGTIGNLTQLEGLYMKNSFSNWEIEGSMVSLSELKCLPYLSVLEIGVASMEQIPEGVFLPSNLSRFKVAIGKKRKHLSSDKALPLENSSLSRNFEVVGASRNAIIKKDIKSLFRTTESLYIEGVNDLENILPCPNNKNRSRDYKRMEELGDPDVFSELKRLVLFELPHLKQICYEEPSIPLFPNLQEVMLSNLHSMQPCGLPIQVAQRLKVLVVTKCENLKYIFWADGNKNHKVVKFSCLNILKLKGVEELLGLFSDRNKANAKSCRALFTNKIIFPVLLELEVTCFNKGRAFWNVKGEEFNQIFPQLQCVKLEKCSMLNCVWSEKILKGNFSFGKLKHLHISKCPKLKNVLFPSVANALQELEELEILHCGLVEQVISTERDVRGDNSAKIIRFPKLKFLKLKNLDGLRCFYKGNLTVEFQALKILILGNLNMVETFLEELVIEENGLQTNKVLFTKKIALTSLEQLTLWYLPSIQILWDLDTFEEFFTRFPALESIDLFKMNLKHVWSKVPRGSIIFKKLKHIEIQCCGLIESLFQLSPQSIGSTLETTSFPLLATLRLHSLEKFRCLFRRKQNLELPALRVLTLYNLSSINTFFEIENEKTSEGEDRRAENVMQGDDNMPALLFNREVSFVSLEKLALGNLNIVGVLDIHSSSDDMISTRFPKLEGLSIFQIRKLKYVYRQSLDQERLQPVSSARQQSQAPKVICFSKLESLYLANLDSLQCFVWGNSSIKFQKLKKLEVDSLPMIKTLYKLERYCSEIREDTDTEDKSTDEELTEEESDGDQETTARLEEGEPNDISTTELDNAVETESFKACGELFKGGIDGFPSLEILKIEDMPELESIWEMDHKEDVAATICSVSHQVGSTTLLPSLMELQLLKLPKLNNVPWKMFPNLRQLVIKRCFPGKKSLITQTSILGLTEEPNDIIIAAEHRELFKGDTDTDGFRSLETLIIEDMPELESIWEMDMKEDVTATICSVSLIKLELSELPKLKNVTWQMLQNLQRLVIRNCFPGAESLITPTSILGLPEEDEANIHKIVFPKLTYIKLGHMSSLCTFSAASYDIRFPSLESIEVKGLPMIKILFKLERSCSETRKESDTKDKPTDEELMEEELDGEQTAARVEEGEPNGNIDTTELDNEARVELFRGGIDGFFSLKKITIEHMPELESIWEINQKEDAAFTISSVSHPVGSTTLFPSLMELNLSELPKLNSIPWQMVPNLRRLVISNCFPGAESLITPTSVLRGESAILQRLESIDITDCGDTRAIVAKETELQEEQQSLHEIVFPKLEVIKLWDMSSLCTFSAASYAIRFPSLERVVINRCGSLRSFSPTPPITPVLRTVWINFKDVGNDDLNSLLQSQSDSAS